MDVIFKFTIYFLPDENAIKKSPIKGNVGPVIFSLNFRIKLLAFPPYHPTASFKLTISKFLIWFCARMKSSLSMA